MAIYSCNLKSIGRTTHQAGTAGAHIRYISRPEAEPTILAQHMPADPVDARTWMDQRERGARKNARVIDKLRIALPRELTDEQRAALVKGFMNDLTGGSIPWYAAIHQRGKDALNPHVHIAVHDRDITAGRRVLRLSDNARDRMKAGLPGPKAVEWVRERWEAVCNAALQKHGHAVRVDRRTLEAQGIDRAATIHEGPRAQHIDDNVRRPKSQARVNGCGRVIDYPGIDQGRTRREFNAHIIDINLATAARSKNLATAMWALFEKEQGGLDRKLELRLAAERRERTAAERSASALYLARIDRLRAENRLRIRAAIKGVADKHAPRRDELRTRQEQERGQLRDRQGRLYIRIIAMIDFTGITRRRQQAARKSLSATHKSERRGLRARYERERDSAVSPVRERYAREILAETKKRAGHLAQLRDRHERADNFADIERQQREIEREHVRAITDRKIEERLREQGKESSKTGDAFMQAVRKSARQEQDRKAHTKRNDRDYER